MSHTHLATSLALCSLLLASAAWAQDEPGKTPPPSFTRKISFPVDVRGTRVALGDVDGDGYPDALISGVLYLNIQNAKFQLAPAKSRLRRKVLAAALADYDQDGDLDVFLSGFMDQPDTLMRNDTVDGDVLFTDVTAEVCPTSNDPNPGEGVAWGDLNGDGYPDLVVANYERSLSAGTQDRLFLSDGSGKLRDASSEIALGSPRCGRGVSIVDYDQDGDLDVYISNYRLQYNLLWQNQLSQTGAFALRSIDNGLIGRNPLDGRGAHSVGSAFGDLDNDGDIDVVVSNFSHRGGDWGLQKPVQVALQSSGWFVASDAETFGIPWQEAHLNPTLFDADDDGDLDLYLTTTYGRQGYLYRNRQIEDGALLFRDATEAAGAITMDGWSSACADVDLDGDLDLVVVKPEQAPIVLINQRDTRARVNSLRLRLRGRRSERFGSGATVTLSGGGAARQVRQLGFGHGTGSQSEPILHFGVGRADGPFEVEVRWPSGLVVRETLAAGLHEIREPRR